MPEVWVPTPDPTGDDPAWSAFAASLDPAAVEAERYRAPGPDERPWSRGDLEVRHAHEWVAGDFWRRAGKVAETRRRRAHDAERFVNAVDRARRMGTAYPTAPISAVLAARRGQSTAGGRAA